MIVSRGYGLPQVGSIVANGLGLKPLDAAMQHSGVVRLWMHELYAQSIDEDHKKRKIGAYAEQPKVETPKAAKPVQSKPKTAKPKPTRQPASRVEQVRPTYPIPRVAQVDVLKGLEEVINHLPLPNYSKLLNLPKNVNKPLEENVVQLKRRKKEEEWLLLLAA
jgi:hypothetical protein